MSDKFRYLSLKLFGNKRMQDKVKYSSVELKMVTLEDRY